jgi:uncharacterized membrane protein (UPF0182 family)
MDKNDLTALAATPPPEVERTEAFDPLTSTLSREGNETETSASFANTPAPVWLIKLMNWLFPVAALLFVALIAIPGVLQKWLWMRQLDYGGIFWTLFSVKVALTCAGFFFTLLFLGINLRYAAKSSGYKADSETLKEASPAEMNPQARLKANALARHMMSRSTALCVAMFAAIFATGFYTQWDTYLRFRYGSAFGITDPIFGTDLGFYMFRLPWYELLQGSLLFLLVVVLGAVGFQYGCLGRIRWTGQQSIAVTKPAVRHLSILLLLLVATLGWGYYLDRFDLLYSTRGVVYGVGYTADHVTLPALWVMITLSAAASVLLVVNFFKPRWKAVAAGAAVFAIAYVVGVMIIPALIQSFVVQPNELSLETPYLKNYIEFTRKAYNLGAIQETAYPAMTDLTPAILARNQDTIKNIRLWDRRPLLQTYEQTQAIRLYYDFYNVHVDRYHLADGYHQVMLSTRELSPELPAQAQTWVNQNLQFTHGYGLVMNFVSSSIGGGFPDYLIQNVPPVSSFGLNIAQPAIYYGESMPGSRIVATGVKEFDYPKGNENVYTSYTGTGGIPIDNFGKRLLFAWTQADINILLTGYLKPESRIQIWRDVQERVSQIAPFLKLDAEPYPVLSEGKLYWIQDAYTTSKGFPYSNPRTATFESGLNYIRNSVKIVVDMYNGSVSFYIMDPLDPVLAVYRQAFPGVFKDLRELSPDLKQHLRYPQDLFGIQAAQYETFHMTDPQVFYNREDLWVPPQETYDGTTGPMDPYYILMKLPGSDHLEYMLMSPFTPQKRDNMISWLAARSDFPDYGKMLFYQLPKDKLIYGPNQISAMINQSTTISEQLTLWNQIGSRVVRGKLIVIPIENSFLYVVPLYLRAEGTNFPQLKRVIVATGDKVVMQPTLDEALSALFTSPQETPLAGAPQVKGNSQSSPAITQEQLQLDAAQKAINSLKILLDESPTITPNNKVSPR